MPQAKYKLSFSHSLAFVTTSLGMSLTRVKICINLVDFLSQRLYKTMFNRQKQ